MSKGLFITAIGTDIGKTYVTGLLVKRLRDAGVNAGYYKAALSGAEEQPDGTWLPGDAVFVAKPPTSRKNRKTLFPTFIRKQFLRIWQHCARAIP